jgi:hypothetical protein
MQATTPKVGYKRSQTPLSGGRAGDGVVVASTELGHRPLRRSTRARLDRLRMLIAVAKRH